MVKLDSYLWCVVVGGLACFTMGFGIGANDVSNNFGTSIGSKAITLGKAVMIAAFFELVGSVLLGASVTDSVRKGVLYPQYFDGQPDLLMYGNMCALITSTIFLILASKYGLSVSTTHSMIGSMAGIGLAVSVHAVNWPYLGTVVLSWIIAPLLSLMCGMLYYWTARQWILRNPDPVKIGKRWLWLLVFLLCVVFMLFFVFSNPVIIKGTPCTVNGVVEQDCVVDDWIYANMGYGFLFSIAFGLVLALILSPICYWKVNRNLTKTAAGRGIQYMETARVESSQLGSSQLLSQHDASGERMGESMSAEGTPVSRGNYDVPTDRSSAIQELLENGEYMVEPAQGSSSASSIRSVSTSAERSHRNRRSLKTVNSKSELEQVEEKLSLWARLYNHLPWNRDLHLEAWNEDDVMQRLHAQGEMFKPEAETFFAVLQIISACVTCVVHGSNDVANATAPFASVYSIYENGAFLETIAVPVWILFLGGGAIGVGLTFLGHHVIKKIGMELVKMTPSRGFSTEMGMATIMVIGSFLGLPLSTTHCLVGSAIGVGLLDPKLTDEQKEQQRRGDLIMPKCARLNVDAINWKLLRKMAMAWVATLVVTAATSCAIFSFSIYGPTRVYAYYDYNGPV